MSTCTFFGHHDCPVTVERTLYMALVDLVEEHRVDTFYVGRQGAFDAIALSALKNLIHQYPHIQYSVVLERIPGKCNCIGNYEGINTMLPEGIETVHPRYAILWRNNWMLDRSDFIVAYIKHSWGGAAKFMEKAAQQGKVIINLGYCS